MLQRYGALSHKLVNQGISETSKQLIHDNFFIDLS
jgi:hypothetical protein